MNETAQPELMPGYFEKTVVITGCGTKLTCILQSLPTGKPIHEYHLSEKFRWKRIMMLWGELLALGRIVR